MGTSKMIRTTIGGFKKQKETKSMINSINQTNIENNQVAIWFLGQASFVLKFGDSVFYLDPYFSNWCEEISKDGPVRFIRNYKSLINPEEVTNATYVVISHDHEDHLDKLTFPTVINNSPDAIAIMPYHSKQVALKWGANSDRIKAIGDIEIKGIKAAHKTFESIDGGERFLGYIIRSNGTTTYFAGDTVVYDGLVERLREEAIDIALLPINGGDYFRESQGIIPNMDYRDAAELAVAIKAKMVIPYHYDLFDCNKENPSYLLQYLYENYPKQPCHVMALGERFIWTSGN